MKTRVSLTTVFVLVISAALVHAAAGGPIIISRVSTDSSGAQGTGGPSNGPDLSATGRYVAFSSDATNLVAGDSNALTDIFLKDTQTGAIARVSTDSAGVQASGGGSSAAAISDDGRYVVFQSDATNLVAGDSNALTDIFLKDTQTGVTTRVSTDSSGTEATGGASLDPTISADGRFVVFNSGATNLVASDSNATADIFLKDTQTGTTTRVSTDSSGTQSTAASFASAVSADGHYVAFDSIATNLVAGDSNAQVDVFLKNTQSGATTRLSTDSLGNQALGGFSTIPTISADGRYIAFFSFAFNLVSGDTNGNPDVFMKDTQSGATTRVSTDSAGNQGTGGGSGAPAISADGRYVAFAAGATNLVPGDSNALADVFLKDTLSGATTRLSTDYSGAQANDNSVIPDISADGRYVGFSTPATNLVPGDSNSQSDVFVTRSSPNRAFTWYDNVFGANWVLFANPSGSASDAWFDLSVAGAVQGLPSLQGFTPGQVPPGGTLYARYPGLIGGPVDTGYHSLSPTLVSQRILWAGNSLEEVVGAESRRLSNHFWWTWYDENTPGYKNWVLVANPSANPVYYQIKIAGTVRDSGSIPPGSNVIPRFPGVIGGPVELEAWSDGVGGSVPASVLASQRVLTNSDTAFNEVPGIPAGELDSSYRWTWYDMNSAGATDWVLIANPSGDIYGNIYYSISIGADLVADCLGPIPDNSYVTRTFPGSIGGPVTLHTYASSNCVTGGFSIVSQRIVWGPSFEEVPGIRSALNNTWNWTWYDQNEGPGVQNWVMIANPVGAASDIYYELRIGGTVMSGGPVAAGSYDTPKFPGVIGGPVQLKTFSDPGHTVPAVSISSQRVIWNGFFNEVVGTSLN